MPRFYSQPETRNSQLRFSLPHRHFPIGISQKAGLVGVAIFFLEKNRRLFGIRNVGQFDDGGGFDVEESVVLAGAGIVEYLGTGEKPGFGQIIERRGKGVVLLIVFGDGGQDQAHLRRRGVDGGIGRGPVGGDGGLRGCCPPPDIEAASTAAKMFAKSFSPSVASATFAS